MERWVTEKIEETITELFLDATLDYGNTRATAAYEPCLFNKSTGFVTISQGQFNMKIVFCHV